MTVVGSATVTVSPDATGFGPRTAAAVKAALAGVEAQIELSMDTDRLRQKISAAVAAAGAGQDIEVDVGVDTDRLGEKIRAATAILDDIDLGVEIDESGVQGELRRLVRSLEASNKINLEAGFGSGGGSVAGVAGDAVGGIFGRAVLRSAARVLAAGGLAQILIAATSGALALAGGLISATGAAGSLVATVAVLPGILSAAAQAAATIGLALGGIGGALKAYSAAQKAAGIASAGGGGGSGGQSAAAARAAERAIRNASRGVEDAQRAMADAIEAANERVEASGRDLIRAQRDQVDAQEDLTRARVEAREEIEELRLSVGRLSLTEAEARRRLTEARTRQGLAEKHAQQDLTGVTEETLRALERQAALEDKAAVNPREKAANDLRDAELDLEEAIAKRVETQAKLTEFERTGIEGTERVIEARERLMDADDRVEESRRDLVRSERDLVRAHEDGARRIAEAEERLADAIADAADGAAAAMGGAAGAANAYQAALDRLSPAARRFVEFLVSLEPLLRRVQATAAEGLFPGLEQAIRTVLVLVDDLEPIVYDTARALAALAIEGANLVASPAFAADLVTQGQRNIVTIQGLGLAGIALVNVLRNITIATGPLAEHLVALVLHFSNLLDRQVQIGRDSGRMEAFFDRVGDRVDRLITTSVALGKALFNVFREATPAGDRYLDTLNSLAFRLQLITERASRSGALRDFFESTRPAVEEVGRLVRDILVGLTDIGRSNFGAFTAFTNQLRTELLPVLLDVLAKIDTDFLSAIVSLATGLANLFGAVLTGNPALSLLVELLGGMAEGITVLLTEIPLLSPVLQVAVTALAALGVVIASVKLTQLASQTFGAAKAIDFLTTSSGLAAPAVARLEAVMTALNKVMIAVAIAFGVRQAIDAIAPSLDKATAAVIRARDPLAEFDRQLRKLEGGGSLVERVAANIRNIFDHGIVGAATKAKGEIATADQAFRDLATSSAASAQVVIDGLRGQGRETTAYEAILKSVIAEKAKQGIAEEEVQKAVAAQTAALKGANAELDRHIDRMRDATNEALTLSGAEISTEEAVDRLSESLERNTVRFDTDSAAGRENKRNLDNLVGSIQREIEELAKAAAAGAIDNERKARLIEHLNFLATSSYPGAREQAAALRLQLELIQNTYTGVIDLDTTRAVAAIDDLTTRLAYLSRVGISAQNNLNLGTAGEPREFGGRVERNRAYVVGEKRPELFIPDQNGVVLPQVPDIAVPKSVTSQMEGLNFMPAGTDFDVEGLKAVLRSVEATLTEALATGDLGAGGTAPGGEAVTTQNVTNHHYHAPLVDIDASFGPGSSTTDMVTAMRAIAEDAFVRGIEKVLASHGAGAGTRGTS